MHTISIKAGVTSLLTSGPSPPPQNFAPQGPPFRTVPEGPECVSKNPPNRILGLKISTIFEASNNPQGGTYPRSGAPGLK